MAPQLSLGLVRRGDIHLFMSNDIYRGHDELVMVFCLSFINFYIIPIMLKGMFSKKTCSSSGRLLFYDFKICHFRRKQQKRLKQGYIYFKTNTLAPLCDTLLVEYGIIYCFYLSS